MDPRPVRPAPDEVVAGQFGTALATFMPNRARPMVISVAAVGPDEIWCNVDTLVAEASTPRIEPVVRTTASHVCSFTLTVEKARRASKANRYADVATWA